MHLMIFKKIFLSIRFLDGIIDFRYKKRVFIAGSSKGRTRDFGSLYLGSIPSPAANVVSAYS